MIRVELKNGARLLFNEWERITTVGWISDDGEYWSDERHHRADDLGTIRCNGTRYIIDRINELGEAVVNKEWLSSVASVRKFIPLAFV